MFTRLVQVSVGLRAGKQRGIMSQPIDQQPVADSDLEDLSYDDGPEPTCMNCGGDGFVDSVAGDSGRYGWDDDGPGTCPNCNGSGLRKDQQWF